MSERKNQSFNGGVSNLKAVHLKTVHKFKQKRQKTDFRAEFIQL